MVGVAGVRVNFRGWVRVRMREKGEGREGVGKG